MPDGRDAAAVDLRRRAGVAVRKRRRRRRIVFDRRDGRGFRRDRVVTAVGGKRFTYRGRRDFLRGRRRGRRLRDDVFFCVYTLFMITHCQALVKSSRENGITDRKDWAKTFNANRGHAGGGQNENF